MVISAALTSVHGRRAAMRGTLLSSHNPVRASSSSTCPGDQPMTWEPLALVPFHSSDDMHDEHCGLHSFAVRHNGIKRWMHACVLGCWLGGLGMRQRCTMVGRRATLARLSRVLLCATCPCCGARASGVALSRGVLGGRRRCSVGAPPWSSGWAVSGVHPLPSSLATRLSGTRVALLGKRWP